MTPHPSTPTAERITQEQLRERILTLGSDMKPEEFPLASATEDLEARERRRAEDSFQSALSRRTWWRLSPEERLFLRARMLTEKPHLRAWGETSLELTCIDEIGRILRQEMA